MNTIKHQSCMTDIMWQSLKMYCFWMNRFLLHKYKIQFFCYWERYFLRFKKCTHKFYSCIKIIMEIITVISIYTHSSKLVIFFVHILVDLFPTVIPSWNRCDHFEYLHIFYADVIAMQQFLRIIFTVCWTHTLKYTFEIFVNIYLTSFCQVNRFLY